MNEELYAKVVNDMVEVFPITAMELASTYEGDTDIVDCVHNQKPTIDMNLEKHVMFPVCMFGTVLINYNVEDKTLEDLFDEMNAVIPTDTILTIDSMLLASIVVRVKERVQGLLDTFANERDYDNIASAISYLTSSVTQFKDEALMCEGLRDQTWDALNLFLGGVMTTAIPLPTDWNTVLAELPTLSWT